LRDFITGKSKIYKRVAAASICLSRQASLPDGSQVLRGKIFFVTFLYRLTNPEGPVGMPMADAYGKSKCKSGIRFCQILVFFLNHITV
jgi:hypothetical protein